MLIADVNVFVNARRRESPVHAPMRRWLQDALNGDEPFGISEVVLSAAIRLITNHRVMARPTSPKDAVEYCEIVRSAPAATVLTPSDRNWSIFADLVVRVEARANVIPDAYLAALAVENGATLITSDRGFARFPGLRTLDPLAD